MTDLARELREAQIAAMRNAAAYHEAEAGRLREIVAHAEHAEILCKIVVALGGPPMLAPKVRAVMEEPETVVEHAIEKALASAREGPC